MELSRKSERRVERAKRKDNFSTLFSHFLGIQIEKISIYLSIYLYIKVVKGQCSTSNRVKRRERSVSLNDVYHG